MRKSSVGILAAGSLVTLTGAWILGSPVFLDSLAVEEQVPAASTLPLAPQTATPEATSGATPLVPAVPEPAAPPVPVTVVVDGAVIDTKYGTVQVQAVLTDGVLVDVIALKLTDSGETSVTISANAAPILREEVLAAQSTAVANVSGATYTSEAYLSSLQAALDSQL
jgi:uncharacterized protein with FMN-binding domain